MNETASTVAQAVANLYNLFTAAISGLTTNALSDAEVLMPKTQAKLAAALYDAQNAFTQGVVDALYWAPTQRVSDALLQLRHDTGQEPPDAVLNALADLTTQELTGCLQVLNHLAARDVKAMLATYRRFAQQVEIITTSRRRTPTQAVVAVRLKLLPLPDRTSVRDQANRMWSGEKYVYTTVRALLVKLYSHAFVTAAAALHHDLVLAAHPEPAKSFVFSISGASPEFPGYLDIQHDTFHPNSRYRLELH